MSEKITKYRIRETNRQYYVQGSIKDSLEFVDLWYDGTPKTSDASFALAESSNLDDAKEMVKSFKKGTIYHEVED